MRELKFRAWTGKKMLYQENRDKNFKPMDGHNSLWYRPISALLGDSNDYEWMQYTGLKDKQGKELWEGDIVNCGENVFETIFMNGQFIFSNSDGGCFGVGENCKIIGNIYQNKKLLEKK
jgi:uncharacterized phage protein (TIGR01671 family)